jgi:hypothetical protein
LLQILILVHQRATIEQCGLEMISAFMNFANASYILLLVIAQVDWVNGCHGITGAVVPYDQLVNDSDKHRQIPLLRLAVVLNRIAEPSDLLHVLSGKLAGISFAGYSRSLVHNPMGRLPISWEHTIVLVWM